MSRRSRTNNINSTRVRKISLQNDYAFGIISPVSCTSLPVPVPLSRCASDEIKIPCIIVRPWQVESRSSRIYNSEYPDMDIDFGIDPLSELDCSPSNSYTCSTSLERFRRWSFSNFQYASKEMDPSGTEFTSQFTSDEENFIACRNNISGSPRNILVGKPDLEENWISEFINSIPEKIRKISTEKRPTNSDTNIYHPDEDLRRQLKKVYVYWPFKLN